MESVSESVFSVEALLVWRGSSHGLSRAVLGIRDTGGHAWPPGTKPAIAPPAPQPHYNQDVLTFPMAATADCSLSEVWSLTPLFSIQVHFPMLGEI